ncbi:MAG: hypothetical protein QM204_00685 [Bacillota bacterium]|jgi:hypothetical protein|nr:hypothetical protein [Bacillota bacterium]NLL26224.1 hypothetical protein [Erysipelotrichia bacterium]
MDNLAYANKKIITGMITVAVSALLLGLSVGYLLTHTILEKTVLNEMLDEGYVLTTDATATAEDIALGKTAYSNGELLNGTTVVFDTSGATATSNVILQGKTAYVNGELIIGTLPQISGRTISPTGDPLTFNGGGYLSSDLIVKGDNNLLPKNIKKGVMIFNVVGSYDGK